MIKNILIIFRASGISFKLILIILFGMILVNFLEIISIGAIFPFLQLLTGTESNIKLPIPFLNKIELNYLGIDNHYLIGLFLIVFLFIIKNLLILLFTIFQRKIFFKLQQKNSEKAISYYLRFDFKSKINSPEILRHFGYISQIYGWLNSVFSLFIELILMISILVFLLYLNFQASFFVVFFIIILSLIFNFFIKGKVKKWSKENNFLVKKNFESLLNIINGLKEIIIFNKNKYFSKRYNESYQEMLKINFKIKLIEFLPRIFLEIIFILCLSIFIVILIKQFGSFEKVVPYLGVYFVAFLKMLPGFTKIITISSGIRYSTSQLNVLIEEQNKIYERNKEFSQLKSEDLKIKKLESIILKNLNFSYGKTKILDDINYEFKINNFYGISGKSGSGKTTLINILIGLFKDYNGQILINKKILLKNNELLWRTYVGVVPQDIFILNDSIKKNIAFGEEEKKINLQQINSSVDQSELREFLQSNSLSLNSILDEKASNVSGGQKHRLGIARALYKLPKLIILDEPTSSLDNQTSSKFVNTLNKLKKDRIIIMISHKDYDLRYCDKVFKIENKKFLIK